MPADSDSADERPTRRAALLRRARAAKSGLSARVTSVGRTAAHRLGTSSVGSRARAWLTDWPEALDEQIDVSGPEPATRGEIPSEGDLVCYIHGFLGEGRLDSVPMSGAHQAAALDAALAEEFEQRPDDPPPVVAVVWSSSTSWWRAERRAKAAGETFASWLDANRDAYDSVTIVGHSLGARVALWTLAGLGETTVDSVALLGAAVAPDAVCRQYKNPIESRVTGTVYNYHSSNDYAVCYLYRLSARAPGLGCHGSNCGDGTADSDRLPDNYVDVDVTDAVPAHRDYYQPTDGGFGDGNCVDLLVERQLDAALTP